MWVADIANELNILLLLLNTNCSIRKEDRLSKTHVMSIMQVSWIILRLPCMTFQCCCLVSIPFLVLTKFLGWFFLFYFHFANKSLCEIIANYFLTFLLDMMNAKQFSVMAKTVHVILCDSFMFKNTSFA